MRDLLDPLHSWQFNVFICCIFGCFCTIGTSLGKYIKFLAIHQTSTSIKKLGYKDLARPEIKILFSSSLYSSWKIININNDMLGNSNRRLLIILQCLQPAGLIGWAVLKIYGEFVLCNINYAFDGWIIHFLPFFFEKKVKGWPARKMMWFFILFILLVAQLLPRTDPIPYSPIF